ncbi:MAG: cytidine deaminase [Elusimicrobia bacterium RIFOXYD12_FULL_66_9]|nr:MAG: cytidine deaminase [Elusimicrobia bacterium RIFOXYD12_FULL_66_9]
MKKNSRAVDRLIETAVQAQKRSYSPYSRYPVGAAVLTASGRVFSGCNVENASYGLSMCAERSAIYHSIIGGHDSIKAVCVVGAAAKPCGACRQVMIEFSDKDTEIYLVDLNPTTGRRHVIKTTVYKLLPMAFDPLASGLLPANPRNLLKRKTNSNRRKKNSRARSRR